MIQDIQAIVKIVADAVESEGLDHARLRALGFKSMLFSLDLNGMFTLTLNPTQEQFDRSNE